jgi:hypothetical protein
MRARPSALLFGRIQVSLTRPSSSRTLTVPMLPPAWGSGMVKYSPLNYLLSSVLMQIGNGPAILTLSVIITSIQLKSSRLSSGRQPHVGQHRERISSHCKRTLCHSRASCVQAHDSGFGGGPALERPKRRSFNPSRTSRPVPKGPRGGQVGLSQKKHVRARH